MIAHSRWHVWCLFLLAAFLCWKGCRAPAEEQMYRQISLDSLKDKIEGGWAGQMIGVSFGEPTEFRHLERIIEEEELPEWAPHLVARALHQDDLYVDMTFARVLDEKGLDATTEDFGAEFRDSQYRLWHANLAARRALRRGVPATESGKPHYNAHANDIDFQIESDFVGLMAPGMPQSSNDLCYRAGRVMNYGDGIAGGMFVSGMYAAAFFENDITRVVETGLACLPPSPYARTISDVLQWSRQNPEDWRKVWQLIEEKWNQRDPCPAGALRPFNIDARLNGAYIALGLLYGAGDFEKTLKISTQAGQDSDCNPSNACGILGVMLGYQGIPEKWRAGIPSMAEEKFDYTDYSFRTIVDSTYQRALALVQRNGGRLEGDELVVRLQEPRPVQLELWDDYGSPVERINWTDARWTWKGDWSVREQRGSAPGLRITDRPRAEAAIAFEGTGAILVGPYRPSGGQADIYLNGTLHRTVDVYSDENAVKGSEAVWHAFGLEDGRHALRIVVRGEPYSDSQGAEIAIDDLIVFR